ncbi:hypothetical protein Taro_029485 [Colocasia esculenta]|uniref:Ultraviolet-B-repressible protein n=1 Tax=Colocasia esculenta TaxID=4460 RepID=A0A843VXC2_COLES|nr:hypothetical protein [Colocasia esculenta]
MASTSAVFLAAPVAPKRPAALSNAFLQPMRLPSGAAGLPAVGPARGLQVRASLKEKAVAGLTAAALTAALVVPDIAEAAQPGVSPSLKNFLLSIVSGGVVLGVILGAVIAVANFDPVKRT